MTYVGCTSDLVRRLSVHRDATSPIFALNRDAINGRWEYLCIVRARSGYEFTIAHALALQTRIQYAVGLRARRPIVRLLAIQQAIRDNMFAHLMFEMYVDPAYAQLVPNQAMFEPSNVGLPPTPK